MALEESVPPDVTALDGLVLAVLAKDVVDDVEDLLVPLEVVVEELAEVALVLLAVELVVAEAGLATELDTEEVVVLLAAFKAAAFAAAAAAAAFAAACCWASKAAAAAFWAAVSVTANALEPIAPMEATSNAADINEIGLMIAPSAN